MDDNDLRLDGNAAGGLLNEVFPFEMTAAATTCSGCGAIKPVGELMLYAHGMGAILRCRRLRRGADSDYAHSRMLPARSERYELSPN